MSAKRLKSGKCTGKNINYSKRENLREGVPYISLIVVTNVEI